jgi:intein/homing endonuclease
MAISGEKIARMQRRLGRLFKAQVPDSPELARVRALPRRIWQEDPELDWLVAGMSQYCRLDPDGAAMLLPQQAVALAEAHDLGGMFGQISPGDGKCVSGDTEVFDAGSGRRRRVDELGDFHTVAKDENGKLVVSKARALASGRKRCMRVVLGDGASVVLSCDHPVYTPVGWVRSDDLQVGQLVATARRAPTPKIETEASDAEVILAAYLLADGGVSHGSTNFTKENIRILSEFTTVANRLADHTKNLQKGWKISGVTRTSKDSKASTLFVAGLSWFRRKWDINGPSRSKRTPAAFWGLSDRQVCLFLNRFWACDGWVDGHGGPEIVLASEKMIDDLRFMLLRLGIHSRKSFKLSKIKSKKREYNAWRLHVGRHSCDRFFETVGPLFGKEESCSSFLTKHRSRVRNTNIDLVPVGSREASAICDEMGFPGGKGQHGRGAGSPRTDITRFLSVHSPGKKVSRTKFKAFCEKFKYTGKLAWLADSDLCWEAVKSVVTVGVLPVYDLSVPDHGCFVGNNFVLHNTLLTFLAPHVLEAQRPLLVVPAKLRGKTADEFAELALVWKTHAAWLDVGRHCVSYEKISREGGAELLLGLRPDLVMFDEAHHVRNRDAAVTRKFEQYFEENPKTRVVPLTGTSVRRSLLDFAHLLRWSLPDLLHPLPFSYRELEAWALVVDVIKTAEQRKPGDPTALYSLCTDEERKLGRDGVRSAVRRRIQETPGVVAHEGAELDVALNVELSAVVGFGKTVEKLAEMLAAGTLPNGDLVTEDDLSAQWRHARTFTSGFWYERYPPPPAEWLEARKAWKGAVRSVLREHVLGLESELLVARAAALGKLTQKQCAAYTRWGAVRDVHKDKHRPVWVDDAMIEAIAQWNMTRTGIIWVSEVALGERLQEVLGLPYYHELGLDRTGRSIKDSRPDHGSIVASVGSASEGNNLQAWDDNLIISLPPVGTVVEQLLARTHRRGQEAREVWCEIFFGCMTEWRCWEQVMRDTKAESLLEGKKRLMRATVVKNFQLKDMRGPLWT